jgi:hypothetical protein
VIRRKRMLGWCAFWLVWLAAVAAMYAVSR